MALTLIVENGTGKTDSNTYISLADAETYFESHLFPTEWAAATDPNKNIALVMAARLLDQWFEWDGKKVLEEQAMRWPRYGAKDRDNWVMDSDIVPNEVAQATAEMALYLFRGDSTTNPDTLGFKEIQVDTIKLVVDAIDRDKVGAIPDAVMAMLEPYGAVRSRGGSGSVKLSRA